MRISKDRKLDMTEGKALGLLLSFSVPILIGNIFQVLYNMVDSVIVGRFVSAEALAAVGTCGSPYNLFVNLNLGTATGAEILGRVGFIVLYIDLFKIGMRGLWYANISNWFITGVFFLIRFLSGKWKEKAFT